MRTTPLKRDAWRSPYSWTVSKQINASMAHGSLVSLNILLGLKRLPVGSEDIKLETEFLRVINKMSIIFCYDF